jgi:hypothetical protein
VLAGSRLSGIADHVWTVAEIVALLDQPAEAPDSN